MFACVCLCLLVFAGVCVRMPTLVSQSTCKACGGSGSVVTLTEVTVEWMVTSVDHVFDAQGQVCHV